MGVSNLKQTDDSQHLILEYFDMIYDSPSHIYHSALPFSPSSSWLRECYKSEYAPQVKVVTGLPTEWDTCSRTIFFGGRPSALAHRGDIIAVGLRSNDIIILDAITGSSISALSGHTNVVSSLAFSLDGTLLVSGSKDKTVKLWDVQTGGDIKTFSGHGSAVSSVSISPDCAAIASGSRDGTLYLWDVRTGKCRHTVINHDSEVTAVSFSPIDSRRLISSSVDSTVRQWDIDGNQIGPPYHEAVAVTHVAYTLDGSRFVSCGGTVATVRDSESGAEVARLDGVKRILRCGCFSPNGRFVALAADERVCVWDITAPEPHLVGNFVGHTEDVISIVFSSSLVSGSQDRSVKFWQIGSALTNSAATYDKSALPAPVPIESVNLFAKDGVAVTSDLSGVVKTWDIATGRCKSSFSTPVKGIRDTHLENDTLIVVWYERGVTEEGEYHIWDVVRGRLLRTVGRSWYEPSDLRISEDGSKLFVLDDQSIQAWSTWTGADAGRFLRESDAEPLNGPLVVHGSQVWLGYPKQMGWDFGDSGVSFLFGEIPDRPRWHFIDRSPRNDTRPARIQDTVTGDLVFRLSERYMKPFTKTQWDGRYLIVGCPSGKVVIMDFNHLYSQ